jgi:hypothetical protein
MSLTISTNHFLLDGHGLTITRLGYQISWLLEGGSSDRGRVFERRLLIERMSDGRTWHWAKKHGRWTTFRGRDDYLDGWVKR